MAAEGGNNGQGKHGAWHGCSRLGISRITWITAQSWVRYRTNVRTGMRRMEATKEGEGGPKNCKNCRKVGFPEWDIIWWCRRRRPRPPPSSQWAPPRPPPPSLALMGRRRRRRFCRKSDQAGLFSLHDLGGSRRTRLRGDAGFLRSPQPRRRGNPIVVPR